MAKGKVSTNENEISILEVMQGELNVCIVGTSPLIFNAMSEKVRHELLMPAPKKNAAAKAANLKHQPLDEYRNSTYQNREADAATRLNFPAAAFKKALASAALDIPGAAKAQIGRLVWCIGDRVNIYGVPQMMMAITRSADMNRTPDVRTRAILPEWACRISLRFMKPILKDQTIANLLAAAGFTQGVGDWRQQKGSGSYGQFQLVSDTDPNFVRICKAGGRVAQEKGLESPGFYDEETERLYAWFVEELAARNGERKNGKAIPNGIHVEPTIAEA
jgi:hypothetical protein